MTLSEKRIFASPIVLVGGGDIDEQVFDTVCRRGYPLIGVDGGALYLTQRGVSPDLVIGDLDSLSPTQISDYQQTSDVLNIDEQQSTDFEKALYSLEAPLFIAFGFWGKRLDHSLTALHTLTKYRAEKRVLMVDTVDLFFIPQDEFAISAPPGTRVSIFPLRPVSFEGSSGLQYPLAGLHMETGAAIGVSNETTASQFSISPTPQDSSNYAVILPNKLLGDLLAAL